MNLNDELKNAYSMIDGSEKVSVVFDVDCDGVTSYLMLKNEFGSKKIRGLPLKKNEKGITDVISKLNDDCELLVFVDIPYLKDEFLKRVVEVVGDDVSILWIDHHVFEDEEGVIQKYNINYVNPMKFNSKDNRSVSYLVYLLCGGVMSNLVYVVIGSLADFFLLDVIPKLYSYNNVYFNKLFRIGDEKRDELFEFVGKYDMFNSKYKEEKEKWIRYLTYDCGFKLYKNFFDFLFKIDDYDEILARVSILERIKMVDFFIEIREGKSFPFNDYYKMMERYEKLLSEVSFKDKVKAFFYEYEGKYSFTKTLAEELCYRIPEWEVVVVCYKKEKDGCYYCSLRSLDLDLNEMLSKVLVGLKASGGGHKLAAGMRIEIEDFSEFKNRVMKYL